MPYYRAPSPALNRSGERCAFVVFLLSTPSYLPGILVLAHSLQKAVSKYPLIVAVNLSLSEECKAAMEEFGLEVRRVETIEPSGGVKNLIAERFKDVWTKLRVFEMVDYDRLCLIDGDMMLRKNMDELFDLPLEKDQIASTHGCVCNLDKSWWAPANWTRENCPWTAQKHPEALRAAAPASPSSSIPETHTLLNAGLVMLYPSLTTSASFLAFLSSTDDADQKLIASWMFPEQNLLAHWYRDHWISWPWQYNAYKTMRYWHGALWTDEDVVNVHYICDKPWSKRPRRRVLATATQEKGAVQPEMSKSVKHSEEGEGETSVYLVDHGGKYEGPLELDLGKPSEPADAVTHGWWWEEYEVMRRDMHGSVAPEVESYLEDLVAK